MPTPKRKPSSKARPKATPKPRLNAALSRFKKFVVQETAVANYLRSLFPRMKVLSSVGKDYPGQAYHHGGLFKASWDVIDIGRALRHGLRLEVGIHDSKTARLTWTVWEHNFERSAAPHMTDFSHLVSFVVLDKTKSLLDLLPTGVVRKLKG